jgi:hypothetical protein
VLDSDDEKSCSAANSRSECEAAEPWLDRIFAVEFCKRTMRSPHAPDVTDPPHSDIESGQTNFPELEIDFRGRHGEAITIDNLLQTAQATDTLCTPACQ